MANNGDIISQQIASNIPAIAQAIKEQAIKESDTGNVDFNTIQQLIQTALSGILDQNTINQIMDALNQGSSTSAENNTTVVAGEKKLALHKVPQVSGALLALADPSIIEAIIKFIIKIIKELIDHAIRREHEKERHDTCRRRERHDSCRKEHRRHRRFHSISSSCEDGHRRRHKRVICRHISTSTDNNDRWQLSDRDKKCFIVGKRHRRCKEENHHEKRQHHHENKQHHEKSHHSESCKETKKKIIQYFM